MKKMTWKKVIAVLMGVAVTASLAACGGRDSGKQGSQNDDETVLQTSQEETSVQVDGTTEAQEEKEVENQAQEPSGQPEENTEGSDTGDAVGDSAETGKTLVVYYSATGHTEGVADYIAAATNADLFELEPVQPYSSDDLNWTDESSRVVYEHDNPDARKVELVAATVDNWESYDTIFIGYPIWWHIAAWPVDSFIAANDFTGKTVIPFCTSSSSGLGESGELLAEAAGTGNWLEGERFQSGASEDEVREWVEGLDY